MAASQESRHTAAENEAEDGLRPTSWKNHFVILL